MLKKGYSRQTIGKNIKAEMKSGRPRRQALAMALSSARRSAQRAGSPEKGPAPARGGKGGRGRKRRKRLLNIGRRLRGMKR